MAFRAVRGAVVGALRPYLERFIAAESLQADLLSFWPDGTLTLNDVVSAEFLQRARRGPTDCPQAARGQRARPRTALLSCGGHGQTRPAAAAASRERVASCGTTRPALTISARALARLPHAPLRSA